MWNSVRQIAGLPAKTCSGKRSARSANSPTSASAIAVCAWPHAASTAITKARRSRRSCASRTKFERSAEAYFAERDLPVELIPLHGSVELAPVVGLADLIVDLVATGNTLREHDMVIVDEIAPSTARFVVNPVRFRTKYDEITALLERLDGTVRA